MVLNYIWVSNKSTEKSERFVNNQDASANFTYIYIPQNFRYLFNNLYNNFYYFEYFRVPSYNSYIKSYLNSYIKKFPETYPRVGCIFDSFIYLNNYDDSVFTCLIKVNINSSSIQSIFESRDPRVQLNKSKDTQKTRNKNKPCKPHFCSSMPYIGKSHREPRSMLTGIRARHILHYAIILSRKMKRIVNYLGPPDHIQALWTPLNNTG